ncbi:MAG: patatin-like phospholipase family protein [Halorientalis sp.]
MSDRSGNSIAIACQGGGSHTAFTAGVLHQLLPAIDRSSDTLVGISGTSGGAFSAVTGWYGSRASGESAPDLLESVWREIAAETPIDQVANDWIVWGTAIESMGVPMPALSPYHHGLTELGKQQLRRTLESHVDFDALPRLATDDAPDLIVGSVDITAGEFVTFSNESITVDTVLASAAVPELFEAVEIDGQYHWDGLLSENPPIRDHFHGPLDRKPDELWVVQINPQQYPAEPKSLREITDRRNELAGNLSLNQELRFTERMNDLVAQGHLPDDEYKHTTIRRIQLNGDFKYASKLDRSPSFIADLFEQGKSRADDFLAADEPLA